MEIKLAALCDHIQVTQDNKLNLLGVFDEFRPTQLPASLSGFLVLLLSVPKSAEGQELIVEAIGQDGQSIFHISKPLTFHSLSTQMHDNILLHELRTVREVISLANVRVAIPDMYRVNVQIGRALNPATLNFVVRQGPGSIN